MNDWAMGGGRWARFVLDLLLKPVFVYKHFLLFRRERGGKGRRPTDRPSDRPFIVALAQKAGKQAGGRVTGQTGIPGVLRENKVCFSTCPIVDCAATEVRTASNRFACFLHFMQSRLDSAHYGLDAEHFPCPKCKEHSGRRP